MKELKINILVDSYFNNSHLEFIKQYFNVDQVYNFLDAYNGAVNNNSVDLIIFTGDTQINPIYYNEVSNDKDMNYSIPKDKLAHYIFRKFRIIPKIGINRGALLLTAFNGGKIISTCDGHNEGHLMHYDSYGPSKETFKIDGNHKSLIHPFNIKDYEIIAWSRRFRSDIYRDSEGNKFKLDKKFVEPEIVSFSKARDLAFQCDVHNLKSYDSYATKIIKYIMWNFSESNKLQVINNFNEEILETEEEW